MLYFFFWLVGQFGRIWARLALDRGFFDGKQLRRQLRTKAASKFCQLFEFKPRWPLFYPRSSFQSVLHSGAAGSTAKSISISRNGGAGRSSQNSPEAGFRSIKTLFCFERRRPLKGKQLVKMPQILFSSQMPTMPMVKELSVFLGSVLLY